MHTCTHTYLHMYLCVYDKTYIYAHHVLRVENCFLVWAMQRSLDIYVFIYIYVYTYLYIYVYIYICVCMNLTIYAYIYVDICMCTCLLDICHSLSYLSYLCDMSLSYSSHSFTFVSCLVVHVESCHVKYKSFMSHMNESRHI